MALIEKLFLKSLPELKLLNLVVECAFRQKRIGKTGQIYMPDAGVELRVAKSIRGKNTSQVNSYIRGKNEHRA